MPNAAHAAARVARARIGWSSLGIAVSLAIIAFASFTLFRLLRDIEVDRIVAALRAVPWRTVMIAICFVGGGYATLTCYDFFALRAIGRRDVPYRIAALASCTSYAIGHNLGATVFTAGAVRFRVYSAWGLGVLEIAKIAFITGLTFWLGNTVMLGIGIAYAPDVASNVNMLPSWANRAAALTALAVIGGYLMWLLPRPRAIGRANWSVTLPGARLTLVQIVIGILDLGCGALAIYTLLPATPSVDLVTVVVTFVIATLLGFLSHAPGSLGVLEAAMLIGLPQYEKEALLASLLIFRLLYFVLPLLVAIVALALLEARRLRQA